METSEKRVEKPWGYELRFATTDRYAGKVLFIKDFTAILNLHRDALQQILGDFRDAYDGEMAKAFGSQAGTRSFRSRFGIVAAVTPAIDKFATTNQQLGERFLTIRLSGSGTKRRIRRLDLPN